MSDGFGFDVVRVVVDSMMMRVGLVGRLGRWQRLSVIGRAIGWIVQLSISVNISWLTSSVLASIVDVAETKHDVVI